jgi:hypothetical protein
MGVKVEDKDLADVLKKATPNPPAQTKKEEPKKEEPKKEAPKKEEPKKEEPKAASTTPLGDKDEEKKKVDVFVKILDKIVEDGDK